MDFQQAVANIDREKVMETLDSLELQWDPWEWLSDKVAKLPKGWQPQVFASLMKQLMWLDMPPPAYRKELIQSHLFALILAAKYCAPEVITHITKETYLDFLSAVFAKIGSPIATKQAHDLADALEKQHEELMGGGEDVNRAN